MPFATPILAITVDLDDTLWPVKPTLIEAERVLADWLTEHAPASARLLASSRRAAIRQQLLAEHRAQHHDMSFVRRELLRRALIESGEDPALAESAFNRFLAARQRVKPYADVDAVLGRWADTYRLIAVSNGNADISQISIGRHFSAAISAHEIGCAKPDPRMFIAACKAAGAAPQQCLHVGDDWHLDIAGARAAGLQAAWVRRPEFAHREVPDGEARNEPRYECLHALDRALHAH